ncbi:hypothetical protein LguiA_021357 [Lonicera macranthoides]
MRDMFALSVEMENDGGNGSRRTSERERESGVTCTFIHSTNIIDSKMASNFFFLLIASFAIIGTAMAGDPDILTDFVVPATTNLSSTGN